MMAEIVIAGTLVGTGFIVLFSLSRDFRAALIWLALPIGSCVYLAVALVLLATTGTLDPEVGLVITAGFGVAMLFVSVFRKTWNLEALIWLAATLSVVTVTVIVARLVHLTRLTPDSMRYLLFAADIQLPDALSEIHRADLVNRQMGLPALHALSSLTDRRYFTSIGPLFGVSGFGFFVWFCWRVTRDVASRYRWMLVASAALFLESSNRLDYDAFYINTHIEIAVFLLIAIAGSWLAVTTKEWLWMVPAGLALGATLLFRPEAPIVAAIVLVALGAANATWPERVAVVAPSFAIAAVWYGVVLWQNAIGGNVVSLSAPVFGNMVAITGAIGVVVAGGTRRLAGIVAYADRAMLAGLVLALVGLATVNLDIFVASIEATFQNVVLSEGAWLFTWSVAIPLLIVALLIHDVPVARLWTTPILGFAVLWLVLPMVRGGAWRVGTGDSGNRILAHMLAVMVAFLVLASVRSWSAVNVTTASNEL